MSQILISIKPEFVALILSGEKRYEFRTRLPKEAVDKLIIYSTYPVKAVVAEARVKRILAFSPKELWQKTWAYAGSSKTSFDEYFANRSVAYAYELSDVKKYPNPKSLSEFGLKVAPQSFAYLKVNN